MDKYILCRRDGEVRALAPSFTSKDPCVGSVRIQGIGYVCGKPEETNRKVREFLDDLRRKGRDKCEEFCKTRASGCKGTFNSPEKCGFTIPPNEALDYGRTMARCNPSCGGEAFIYCSIYKASYLRFEEALFTDKTPNCYCGR